MMWEVGVVLVLGSFGFIGVIVFALGVAVLVRAGRRVVRRLREP